MAAKPRCHTDEDEDNDNKKVYNTKKVLFVDSYGIKSFPCRGRRKHFSCLKQILGNSTDRHNDLFGMTIFQFEREYKACLERRKQNGIWIIFDCSNYICTNFFFKTLSIIPIHVITILNIS
jgi:hypothetical protein